MLLETAPPPHPTPPHPDLSPFARLKGSNKEDMTKGILSPLDARP